MEKTVKARIIRKLLLAKNYIVVTEKEAFMKLTGLNPKNRSNLIKLGEQRVSLELMRKQLDKAIDAHDKYLPSTKKSKKRNVTTTKEARK